MDAGAIWDLIILNPMINILIVLTKVLFNNLGLTIIALTIIIRAAMYPLTRSQLMSTKRMQELQPKLQEIQKKYAKDRQRLAKEQMDLYKQAGINPIGCLVPMLTQMPIWLALYQSIVRVLATGPEELLNLSRHLYVSWPTVFSQVPLPSQFLWFDLGTPDTFYVLPILVGVTMWIQQKMSTPNYGDPQQQANSQMMLWMMPILFTFFSLSFPSGLALYWLVSNIISVAMQYYISGWGALGDTFKFLKKKTEIIPTTPAKASPETDKSTKKSTGVVPAKTTPTEKEAAMDVLEISAKTVDEAIEKALDEMGLTHEEVKVTILSEGKSGGLFGFGSEEARVKVERLTQAPNKKAEVIAPELVKAAQDTLETLLKLMEIDGTVVLNSFPEEMTEDSGEPIAFNIEGDDLGILIGRRGQTLAALQYILRIIVGHKTTNWIPIVVDAEGYKDRRHEALKQLAMRMADTVKTRGTPFTLEPMPPYERRIVHLTLVDDPAVFTESIGEGDSRQVVIRPKRPSGGMRPNNNGSFQRRSWNQ